jgi:hypothetical protein
MSRTSIALVPRIRPTPVLMGTFLLGFGLGTWYGAQRTIARIRSYVGPEKWDRMKRTTKPKGAARGPAR